MPLPTRVPTLLYHDVVADERWTGSGFPGGDAAIYKLDSDAFTRLAADGSALLSFETPNDEVQAFDIALAPE